MAIFIAFLGFLVEIGLGLVIFGIFAASMQWIAVGVLIVLDVVVLGKPKSVPT